FTFSAPGSPDAIVTWKCTAATPTPLELTVSPTSLTAGDSNCPQNSDGSWTCTTTVTAKGSQGSLTWSVTSSSSLGASFNPSSGTLPAGQSQAVKITIPSSGCTNGSFSFSGGTSPVSVPWSCTPTPTPTHQRLTAEP